MQVISPLTSAYCPSEPQLTVRGSVLAGVNPGLHRASPVAGAAEATGGEAAAVVAAAGLDAGLQSHAAAQLLAELVGEERRAVLLEFSKREQGIPELGGVAWVRVAPGRSSAPAAPPRVLVCASLQSVTRRTAGDAVGVLRRCGPEAALVLLRDSAEDDAGFWLERLAESWSGWERLELGGFVAVCRRTGPRRSRAGE